jgi:hypothetical protein
MVDEKDRLGDKLRQKEKADEDRFFAERDKAVLEKLRRERGAAEADPAREAARGRCPRDGDQLAAVELHGVKVDECPTCHGTWLDANQLETVAQRERDSWLGRLFYRPRR